jgi:hypothetical protein
VALEELARADEPFVVLTYGPSGIGKTTDMGYSFPTALFLAAPGALSSIQTVCGYTPTRRYVETIQQATELIQEMGKTRKHNTVVIDDFSFMAEQTFSELEKKHTGFTVWSKMRDVALRFRDISRYAGINVVLNAWEQPPKNRTDGSRVRGGPQLSGKLPESIPALCDMVLRAVHEPQRQPWPAAYICNTDPNYVMKDRFNIATLASPAPMNLAELLRARGKYVARHPDHSDQEEMVATIAEGLSGSPQEDHPLLNDIFTKLLERGRSPYEVRWLLRDAVDRATIRLASEAASLQFLSATKGPRLL